MCPGKGVPSATPELTPSNYPLGADLHGPEMHPEETGRKFDNVAEVTGGDPLVRCCVTLITLWCLAKGAAIALWCHLGPSWYSWTDVQAREGNAP